jgi:hypothetical protein
MRVAKPAKLCRVELDAIVCFQRVAAISTWQVCRVDSRGWRLEASRWKKQTDGTPSGAFGSRFGAGLPSAFDTSQHEMNVARGRRGKSTDEVQIEDRSITGRTGLDFGPGGN